jgi:plasmid stabilization system protein ParE
MPRSAGEKPLEWARAARDAFEASIDFIASEDLRAARLVVQRVEDALRLIQAHPKIGKAAGLRGRRMFPIPNTGHIVNYRETRSSIRILRWYRSKQHVSDA